jgi:hypothetical protein
MRTPDAVVSVGAWARSGMIYRFLGIHMKEKKCRQIFWALSRNLPIEVKIALRVSAIALRTVTRCAMIRAICSKHGIN